MGVESVFFTCVIIPCWALVMTFRFCFSHKTLITVLCKTHRVNNRSSQGIPISNRSSPQFCHDTAYPLLKQIRSPENFVVTMSGKRSKKSTQTGRNVDGNEGDDERSSNSRRSTNTAGNAHRLLAAVGAKTTSGNSIEDACKAKSWNEAKAIRRGDMKKAEAERKIAEEQFKARRKKSASTGHTSHSTVAAMPRRPAPPRPDPRYENTAVPVNELAYYARIDPPPRHTSRSRASRNQHTTNSSSSSVPTVAPGASDRSSRGNNSRRDSSSSGKGSQSSYGGVFEFSE